MASEGSEQRSVYKLGRVAFSVENSSPTLSEELDALIPKCQSPATKTLNNPETLRTLQNRIYELHDDCLWLDAGCLITPSGKSVLIIGRSGAGKSTTTMAMALAYNCKVVAEDILLIDLKNDTLITFGAPFSLKPGTLELLRESVGKVPSPIIGGEWSPLGDMVAPRDVRANFDVSLVFTRNYNDPKFRITTISPAEFYRKCLPISNILRMKGAADKLLNYIGGGVCLEIEDGTVQQRVHKILELIN